jgi:oxygen-independent coproporphyrinogen-3 oxidase
MTATDIANSGEGDNVDKGGTTFGVYLHFPFCQTKCGYCDFPSYAVAEDAIPQKAYTEAILRELQGRQETYQRGILDSIFLGGGTPSLWDPSALRLVIEELLRTFRCSPRVEITLEANPNTLSLKRLEGLSGCGINRLSLGIQSLDDQQLRLLGRSHDAAMARKALERAREVGFRNLSCDIMLGLPKQTPAHHLEQLEGMIALAPSHLSVYALTLAPHTPLARRGLLPTSDEEAALMMEQGRDVLEKAGYTQYEVSNFALPEAQSRHNCSGWQGHPYLGLGAFAHSMAIDGPRNVRIANPHLEIYLEARSAKQGPPRVRGASFEVLDPHRSQFEMLFLGLRTIWGIEREAYRERFGIDLMAQVRERALELCQRGLLEETPTHLKPSRRGIFWADELALRLMP